MSPARDSAKIRWNVWLFYNRGRKHGAITEVTAADAVYILKELR